MAMSIHSKSGDQSEDSFGSFVLEIVKMFLLAVVIIVPIRVFLFQPFIVRGQSMEPNFSEKEYLIVNELGYKHINFFDGGFEIQPSKTFSRRDIVVFHSPRREQDYYIKRIIGLPGEAVRVSDGRITIINDENPEGLLLDESEYLPIGRRTAGTIDITLSDDEYFVMGDNRNASSDSREFGPVKADEMIGRVFVRAFPFSAISFY